MEQGKFKILCVGHRGLLLPKPPESVSQLFEILARYYRVPENHIKVTFKDEDRDECMVLDELTYQTALSEFTGRIIMKMRVIQNTLTQSLGNVTLDLTEMKYIPFFKKQTNVMGVFDLDSEDLHWVRLPHSITLKPYAAWVLLPNGSIFYCGGGHPVPSSECFLIDPATSKVKRLPDMIVPRHSHGIAYRSGHIYVFGGYHSVFVFGGILSKAERFNLEEKVWEELTEMESARTDVGTTVCNNKIFVMGKGSTYVTEYDSSENVRIDLQEDEGGCLVALESFLYVFQGSKMKTCDLGKNLVVDEVVLPKCTSWWSHCPPVVHNEKIYFLWWEEPEYLCSYDVRSREFRTVVSFSNVT